MSSDIQELLKSGVEAARSGNKVVAKAILEQVIQLDSQNEVAWMWLASVSETASERQRALQRVLSINPNNERAKQALAKFGTASPAPSPPPKAEAAPPPAPPKAEPVAALKIDSAPPQKAEAPPLPRAEAKPRGTNPLYFLMAILAVVVLVLAGALAVMVGTGFFEDPTPTPVLQRPTVLATRPPPTFTPPPAIVTRNPMANLNELPPTWTPSPMPTDLPTQTPTPLPSDPSEFEIIFSMQENPAALARLHRILGDGSNLSLLDIRLQASDLSFGEATPTSAPEVSFVTPGEEVLAEATAEAEEAPQIQAAPFEQFEFTDPAWSFDGEMLAFTAQISPSVQEIFLLNLQTNRVRQLTELGASITDGAAWSPDGRTIAFSSNLRSDEESTSPVFDLYIINVETGVLSNLTNGEWQNREPVWTPDGQTLVFSSDRNTPNELEIWALPLNSITPVQLTNNSGSSFSPAVSHNGEKIAFISNRSGDNDLYIMNSDGTSERLISLNDDGADDRDPAWSPDDNWLIVSSTRDKSRVLQLWILNANGQDWQKLTDGLGGSRYAVWQPITNE